MISHISDHQHSAVLLPGAFEGHSSKPWSFAFAFVVCAFGYWSVAPLLQLFATDADDATFTIGFRVFTALFVAWTFLFAGKSKRVLTFWAIAPFMLYCIAFMLRMYDNFFIKQFTIYLGPTTAFFTFIGSGILPALMVQRFAGRITDYHFAIVMLVMALAFLLGLSFNIDQLLETSVYRISLDKVNAITLTSISLILAAAMLFLVGSGGKFKPLMLLVVPLLLGVAVLSKSRGPMVSTGFAVLAVIILGRTKYRVQAVVGALSIAILAVVAGSALGLDVFDLAFSRFTGGSEDGQVTLNLRESMWSGAWGQFLDAPLFGQYMFELQSRMYPHNIVLESLMATGLFGSIFLFVFLWQGIWAAARILANPTASRFAMFMAFIFFKEFAQALSSGSSWAVTTLWISGLTIICLATNRSQERTQLPNNMVPNGY